MPALPLITIVTPSYNQGRFIEQTIHSVLSQDYPKIECLVMDGGSTDDTIRILRQFNDEITWVSEKDLGQAHAINKGFKRAKGEIIAWLNSDDWYIAGTFRKVADAFARNPQISMVYGEGYHVDENGNRLERYPTEPFNLERFRETCYICQPTVFLRRSVLDSVGCLDESLHYGLDYDYWIRVGKQLHVLYLPEYLACSRIYASAKTLRSRVPVHKESIRIMKKHFEGVCSKWIFDYGHAVMESVISRDSLFKKWVFALGVSCVSSYAFLRHYGRIPRTDIETMLRWIGGASRVLFQTRKSFP